jgi:hypothetical protein
MSIDSFMLRHYTDTCRGLIHIYRLIGRQTCTFDVRPYVCMHVCMTRRTRALHASLLVCRDTRSDQRRRHRPAHAHIFADVSRRCDSRRGTSACPGEGVRAFSRGLHPRRWRAVASGGLLGGYSGVLPVPLGDYSARPLRHGRGPRCAVPSCAGAYVSGAAGSNACPAGFVRIETEAACRTAAAAAGKAFDFVETDPAWPRGCYYGTTNAAAFNTHAVGAGNSDAQLLCATGAPIA